MVFRIKHFPFNIKKTAVELQGQQVYANTLTTRINNHTRGTYVVERQQHEKIKGVGHLDIKGQDCIKRVYDPNGLSPALTTTSNSYQHNNHLLIKEPQKIALDHIKNIAQKTRPNENLGVSLKENGDVRVHRMDEKKSGVSELAINHEQNVSNTLTASHMPKIYGNSTGYEIRKLTPRECWRLQGFPDWAFERAEKVNSNSQLYKQAGNSVTVNVVYEIAKKLEELE